MIQMSNLTSFVEVNVSPVDCPENIIQRRCSTGVDHFQQSDIGSTDVKFNTSPYFE